MPRKVALVAAAMAMAVAGLAGCGGGGLSADDAVDELVSSGLDRSTAQCFVDELVARDVAPEVAIEEAGPDDEEAEAAVVAAGDACFDADEVADLVDEMATTDEEFREITLTRWQARDGITEAEAICLWDDLRVQGFTAMDLVEHATGDGDSADVDGALVAAATICLG